MKRKCPLHFCRHSDREARGNLSISGLCLTSCDRNNEGLTDRAVTVKRYLLLLWFLPLLVLAQNIPVYTGTERMIRVTSAQPTFIIQLKSNPTTGYSWFLKDYDSSSMLLLQHRYIRPDNRLIGASGVEEWKFQLMPSAFVPLRMLRLEFIYKRPWENKTFPPITIFNIQTRL